uniref:putative FBD-associated F-box protein At5g53635 isoform X1 n=1 Tax=Fragaria vesca subsp. vesca TaxID=101020 RepID=UPI0005C8F749|nr:PREDICTED: putative FBD-associated F-box protein At5g53635 isoform X1 [Fragaria vesca subsp. vesca]
MEFLASSRERVIDRFTNLPNDVACHILSFVSFRDSARVGCLSRRCKELYLGVRNLDFDSAHANYAWDRFRLLNCLDRFMLQRGEKDINKFRIHWIFDRENNDEYFRIMSWISYAVKCNVGSLIIELSMFGEMTLELPSCIFHCKSLRHLIVDVLNRGGKVLKMPSLACYSNLQSLKLKNVTIQEEFGKWISECCKSIKELSLEQVFKTERISIESLSLESFSIACNYLVCSKDLLKLSVLNISGEKLAKISIVWQAPGGIDYLQIFSPNVKDLTLIGIFRNYISLGTLMCLEKSIISPVGIYDSNKALEVLCSVSRAKVLNLMGDIIKLLQVVFRDGCRTPPLDNVCCFSVLSVFSSLSDDLVPPMATLLKTMPNLIDLQLSSAVISVNSRTSSSGFNISYWKSLNLAFVDRLQNATLSILNGNNEVEFAAYLLENATNLKKMVIYHSGQHSAIRWLQNKSVCSSTANVFFMELVKRN